MTPLQTWDKSRRNYLSKIVNAKKAMAGYFEEVFTLHEHLLGKELCHQWTEIVKKTCFVVGWKDEKGDSQTVQRGCFSAALELVLCKCLVSVFTDDAAEQQRMYMSFFPEARRSHDNPHFFCTNEAAEFLSAAFAVLERQRSSNK